MNSPAIQTFAFILGIVGVLENLVIFISTKRDRILKLKFLSDIIWCTNYFLTGAYTGGVLNLIALGRETVFYNRDKKEWARSIVWLYVFLLCALISPTLEWIKAGGFTFIPLFPAVGTAFCVMGFYNKDPLKIKIFCFIGNILWVIYSLTLKNYPSLAGCSLAIISSVIGLVREFRKKINHE